MKKPQLRLFNASYATHHHFRSGRVQSLQSRAIFTNSTMYMEEAIIAKGRENVFHFLHTKRRLRYHFGSSFNNYCQLTRRPQGWLPSLPRVMEMKIGTQAWIRASVLLSFNIKFVVCLARSLATFFFAGGGARMQVLCWLLPFTELFSSAVLAFMTTIHQEQDKSLKWTMYYNFPVLTCLFLLGGVMHLTLDVIDQKRKFSTLLFNIKVSCLIAFGVCASTVHSSFLDYLGKRPCHTYVPLRHALMEYICVASLVIFSLTHLFGLRHLEFIVMSLPNDQTMICTNEYTPAFTQFPESKEDK
ncbi:hypothetical protein GCK32_002572 [Trichostrongylus colubriformis]|uniref:Uncharacterized protein n=1 Tax=Trichostrongylus colubriformis TaxID=6319 RepID=A0AAN8FSK6_TRICO